MATITVISWNRHRRAGPVFPVPRPGQILITGDVVVERALDTTELHARAGAIHEIRYTTRRCCEIHQVQGVLLHELLKETCPLLDNRHKMGRLNVIVLALSEDGYQVVLSLPEIDPEFGACAALLATRYNGQVLTRPTLVMPHDNRASRYVRNLCQLRLHSVGRAGGT